MSFNIRDGIGWTSGPGATCGEAVLGCSARHALSLSPYTAVLRCRVLLRCFKYPAPGLCSCTSPHLTLPRMDGRDRLLSDSDDSDRPSKRPRHSDSFSSAATSLPPHPHAPPTHMHSAANGNGHAPDSAALPPLSLSILGVEPLDEFIREVADFIHYQISTRPQDLIGAVEVEAKIGVLRDRDTGQRLQLPVRTETSTYNVPPPPFAPFPRRLELIIALRTLVLCFH